jgi:hypothetical protein
MRALLLLPLTLICFSCATPSVTPDGLVSTRSGRLDELYYRPHVDIAKYRAVIIEPVPVKFRADYLSQKHGLNYLAQPMSHPYQNPDAVERDFAALMKVGLVDAFRSARCQIASIPGADVLRISAKVDELFINAPDRLSSSVRATMNRDAGQATLSLEATDSTNGLVLARVVHRNIIRQASRLNVADDASNQLWFETAFRRWAANVATEFGHSRHTQISQAR